MAQERTNFQNIRDKALPEPQESATGRSFGKTFSLPIASQAFLSELETTIVFETYWRFAAGRQSIYLKRVGGEPEPWTDDPILQEYKFTNAFRAADRVSQYCIREVIYEGGSMDPKSVVFRVLLFKFFNTIAAWETLIDAFGPLTWENFDAAAYGKVLGNAWAKGKGVKIWGNAYTQKPQTGPTRFATKHERYLEVFEKMMQSGVTEKLLLAGTYEEAVDVLRFPPLIGNFTAMQMATDLNYSPVLNFDEDDFIVAGPGALDGINKCFDLSLTEGRRQDMERAAAIIAMCADAQEEFFHHFGLKPVTLFGRRLHLIDCQNLFCETDKYAREAYSEFNQRGRTEIRNKLKPKESLPLPFFPPKWKLII